MQRKPASTTFRGHGLAVPTAIALTLFATGPALAADQTNNARIHGIAIGTYQGASESRVNGRDVENEANGQFLLSGELDMGPGTWGMEIRGGTSPRTDGVTSFYGTNASVGETLDSDGNGRIAATQLYYELPVGPGQLRVGLLDPTALLDGDAVANDEYTQFLADAFVNNPTIGFPSFVLGVGYQGRISSDLGYTLFASSSSGLEDGADPTYDNVFDVDDDGKGVFSAAQVSWRAQSLRIGGGIWTDSSDHARLDDPNNDDNSAYGAYGVLGGDAGRGQWSLRLGIANDKVQADANFISLAYSAPVYGGTLGTAVSRRGDSDHLTFDSDPIYQAEAYWRFNVAGNAYISPDLQYIENSAFRSDRDGVVVAGIRAGVTF